MFRTKEDAITLANINEGAAEEMFAHQLQRVLDNMVDINTVNKPRKLTMEFIFHPGDGGIGEIEINSNVGLAAIKGCKTKISIGRKGNKGEAREIIYKQQEFPEGGTVTKLERKEKTND